VFFFYALLAQSQAVEVNFIHEPRNAFFLVMLHTSKGIKSLTYQLLKIFSQNVVFHESASPSITDTVHTPLVFPNFPQTYDSISCTPAKSAPQNSVPPENLALMSSIPAPSSFENNDVPNLRRSERLSIHLIT